MSRVLVGLVAAVLTSSQASAQQAQTSTFQAAPVAPGIPPGPPRDNVTKPGTATIRGHVVAADTGQPLRKAQVSAFSAELRESRVATTDARGQFELKELPAGRYSLSASKGSYVALQYGQTRPFEAGRPLEILDAQTVEKVDFSLPRGGIITGRILDEFGEPAIDVQVMPMRFRNAGGQRQLGPTGRMSTTNDIGEFRLFALSPGEYYISATLRNSAAGINTTDDRSGYAQTYYPGTANVGEAQRVTIGLGETVYEIVFPLLPIRTARISGTALDSDGRPIIGFVNAIQRTAGMFTMGGGGFQTKPDGSFTIGGLAPGDYTLTAQMPQVSSESATLDVSVNGDDITGVRLVGVKPVAAAGRIILEGSARQSVQPSTLRVSSFPAPVNGVFRSFGQLPSPAIVNDDFTFEAKARPGRMRMTVTTPPGWTIKAVRLHSTDVTDEGIEFKQNEDVGDIEIELTNRVTAVTGFVTNSHGEPSKDYSLIVFAQDRARWTGGSRYIRTGRPDQDGRFKVGLPAGKYYAIAVDYVDPGDATDPELLDRVRSKATAFSLGDGETKTVDLKLSSAQ
jgi:hypothetical protein